MSTAARLLLAQAAIADAGHLLVAERFGPTFQGEGPSCGQRAAFVRLSRCNLRCPPCDTPYTWDWRRFDPRAEAHRESPTELADWALGLDTELVVVTGGEPLLQQQALIPFATAMVEAGRRVEVETNGTVAPLRDLMAVVASFNVSPKLRGFAGPSGRPIDAGALTSLVRSGRACFKFVVASVTELDGVAELVEAHDLAPVWIMPCGTDADQVRDLLRQLADPVLERRWNLTDRLHVQLWGDQRGR
ncbi:7-carboxy-7-deazaguanine synthase QueE [Embleya sp. NPDC059237]|uniref:7-carboxy-7-deazaguanine synthase QueE n=1 Tax=Embleya sp. NPDC059237 TaxID=3346784 RepID=UPI0036AF366B